MKYNTVQLKNIVTMKYGKMPPVSVVSETGYPIYSGYGVTGFAKQFLYKEPQLIVVARGVGGTGDVKISPVNAWITNLCLILEIDPKQVDKLFLYYKLQKEPLKENLNTGAAQAQITISTLENYKISVPKLSTQQKIASILSAYDDLIDINRRRIQLLEESARLLFREWFVYFRFPLRLCSGQAGHEKVHPVRKSTSNGVKIVDGVPEGWERYLLEDIAKVKKGRNITFEQAVEGDIPVVGGGLEPTYYHNKANVSAPVITISASGANAGFVNLYDTDIWASDCSYIDKNSTKYIYYLCLILKSLQTSIFGLQVGAAQPHVYPKDLNRLRVLIAPDDLCRQFEQLVTPIFDLIRTLKLENQKLAQARDLLLPRLMSGRIDPVR